MSQFQRSNKAKNNILAKLNAVLDGADPEKLPAEVPFDYAQHSHEEMLKQLVHQLRANHAEVFDVTPASIASVISEQLQQRGISKLMYGQQAEYSPLFSEKLSNNIQLTDFSHSIDQCKQQLFFDTPAGITGARCAIAATGTLVLWPDIDEPRTLSLVPPVHLVIIDKHKVYRDFASVMEQEQWSQGMPTNVILLSGPSKTADIQQTLAYGAHGPKELLVLLLDTQGK